MKKNLTSQNKEGVSAFPFPTSADHGARASVEHSPTTEVPSEDALDHGIEESFPASDPVSVSVTKLIPIASGAKAPSANSDAGGEDPGTSDHLQSPHPGDEAAPGSPGTGEGLCRECGGTGRTPDGAKCQACDGSGKVTVGIGGA
jgi:hypothetical protein